MIKEYCKRKGIKYTVMPMGKPLTSEQIYGLPKLKYFDDPCKLSKKEMQQIHTFYGEI